MHDVMGPAFAGATLGYCTNVHAGATLEQTKKNLDEHAVAVKGLVSPDAPMGIGLWLCAKAARELLAESGGVERFRDWLGERGLYVFTMNGFPYHDFHEPVVKHRVYQPDWSRRDRLEYTVDLVNILAGLSSAGDIRSISTLPLAWRSVQHGWSDRQRPDTYLDHLLEVAALMERADRDLGIRMHLDVEPEPGCLLDRSEHVVALFEDLVARSSSIRRYTASSKEEIVHRHLAVCHDVCHASVMFEDQRTVLNRYTGAGIQIGKVQLSNAVRMIGDPASHGPRHSLGAFAEDRYLHQTVIRSAYGQSFFDDLPAALESDGSYPNDTSEWRVHFHVPVYLDDFDQLMTTRHDICACLKAIAGSAQHFEVETYAWNVLPTELQRETLAEGIADELRWVMDFGRSIEV